MKLDLKWKLSLDLNVQWNLDLGFGCKLEVNESGS